MWKLGIVGCRWRRPCPSSAVVAKVCPLDQSHRIWPFEGDLLRMPARSSCYSCRHGAERDRKADTTRPSPAESTTLPWVSWPPKWSPESSTPIWLKWPCVVNQMQSGEWSIRSTGACVFCIIFDHALSNLHTVGTTCLLTISGPILLLVELVIMSHFPGSGWTTAT